MRIQYETEKRLAAKLNSASPNERLSLYGSVYDEFFRAVPINSQATVGQSRVKRQQSVSKELRALEPLLDGVESFLEIGCGDGALSLRVAERIPRVHAMDASPEPAGGRAMPANCRLLVSQGIDIPLAPGSVCLAYSNQWLEHLHPDDALTHLQMVATVLKRDGRYVCATPNRLSGPHDISGLFDDIATGLHLKEYTIAELRSLFRHAGFSGIELHAGGNGRYVRCPFVIGLICESLIAQLPLPYRRSVAGNLPFRSILGIRLVGIR